MDKIITIATLNTLGIPFIGNSIILRYKTIADYLNSSDIDIIHLQEMLTYGNLYLIRHLLEKYPYRYYEKSLFSPKGGLATFSKMPLEYVKFIKYPNTFRGLGKSLVDTFLQKGILITKTRDTNTLLLNTHFNAVLDANWEKTGQFYEKQQSQIKVFHKILENLGKVNKLIVCCGDFNIARDSQLFRELITPKLYDVFASKSIPTFHPLPLSHISEPKCLDYFFIYGSQKQYSILSTEYFLDEKVQLSKSKLGVASDHMGLKIVIKL
jgi:endonuclease/exonuclease/phosphatase family metal-dependent hydrolase